MHLNRVRRAIVLRQSVHERRRAAATHVLERMARAKSISIFERVAFIKLTSFINLFPLLSLSLCLVRSRRRQGVRCDDRRAAPRDAPRTAPDRIQRTQGTLEAECDRR
jgi:hypothetical protein